MDKINILLVGATGSGKSSTINALLGSEEAKVGYGVDPETMTISRYEYGNKVLWDSPGLGDGKEADKLHSQNIIKKLLELDSRGCYLIDQVIVVVDGSSRDLGTTYKLLESVIMPNLENGKERLLVAINQADRAMKGRHWNYQENKPEPVLKEFLEKKVVSVKRRIKESTGIDVKVVYYSSTSY
ncbi:GTPase family protein [Endozoicomonas sp. 8E]|uniref:GTPase family protein n=1 Tax=Endozoicomonas sp. 8E TaxID=3035692 RepID=UPI0029394838|nr:GTPase [Endozoicomonas sp. 8E]WOG29912.1 50S ribosome-binding GTPase [Endozoicomonas sp. 8E]